MRSKDEYEWQVQRHVRSICCNPAYIKILTYHSPSWTELAYEIRCIPAVPNNFSNVSYLAGVGLHDKLMSTGLETVLKTLK
jgi:hypothetical protein